MVSVLGHASKAELEEEMKEKDTERERERSSNHKFTPLKASAARNQPGL